ncbi:hypothetical protein B4Q04_09430 [Zobellia sp. OII3]|nr:hypothetical protein B4Q04_09430 [Zobellia sp. OII3]
MVPVFVVAVKGLIKKQEEDPEINFFLEAQQLLCPTFAGLNLLSRISRTEIATCINEQGAKEISQLVGTNVSPYFCLSTAVSFLKRIKRNGTFE